MTVSNITRPTQKQIAEHLDLSVSGVKNLIADEIFNQYMTLNEIRVCYIRFLRSFANGRNQPKKSDAETDLIPGTLDYEKLRLTKAQADNMEIKNQISRGEVAPIELIEKVITSSSAEASGILDSLPLMVKRKHPELSSQIIESIKRQVVKAQNAIARSDSAIEPVLQEYISSLEAG